MGKNWSLTEEQKENRRGKNSPRYHKAWTEEQREKARERAIEQWKTPKFRDRMTGKNNPMYGKVGKNNPNYGNPPWNKDLTKETDIRLKRVSESRKGEKNHFYSKKHTPESIKKMKKSHIGLHAGEKHPMWGKQFSEKSKRKMSKSHTGKPNSEEHNRNISQNAKTNPNFGMKGKYHNIETRKGQSKKRKEYLQNHPEAIEKIKKDRAKRIFPLKDSSIEVKIQELLRQLGFDFFTHQYMKIEHGYQCDVFIPSLNLVIEADGDYWHKYPVGNELDHVRTKELLEKGFKVLRLWEREIKTMDLKGFEDIIIKVNGDE